MRKVEEFVPSERDRKAFFDFVRSYDLDDDEELENMAFILMGMNMFVAERGDAYHVIGVLQCTINHIYRTMEGEDGRS